MKTYLIKNNLKAPYSIGAKKIGKPKMGLRLSVGLNEVAEKDYIEYCNNRIFLKRVKNGDFNVIDREAKVDSVEIEPEIGLNGISTAKAKELINETFDLKLLKKFQEQETASVKPRKVVLDLLEAQIKEMETPPPTKTAKKE